MGNLDIIEAAKGGPFVVMHDGQCHVLPDPADLTFQQVLSRLQAEHLPETPPMPSWKHALVFPSWSAHYDLPDFQSAQRLTYLLDRYRSALVYDLQTFSGVDLGILWRSRRWRTLLDLIDHLPGHSWYSSAVSGDEDHAAMLAESIASREAEGEKGQSGPPMHTWTPEVAALTQVLDAVRGVNYTLAAVNWPGKGKRPEPPAPSPRPATPLDAAIKRASFNHRKSKHDQLAKRLLPHKR